MASGQPQSYGSIREFLDNLPNQPCIWQPENPNICVTCLRINEPVARICSVWAQALEEAPLEEIDFEEEVRSLPSVVEVEDEFEIVETAPSVEIPTPIAEVDIVEASNDWDMSIEPVIETTEEVTEAAVAEPVAVEDTEEVTEAAVAEPVAVEDTEEVAEVAIAEPVAVETTEEVTEAAVAEPVVVEDTEEVVLETVQDAVDAENIAKENLEIASQEGEIAAEAVVEAVDTEAEAVEAYAEAVKEEETAAEAVVEAIEAENVATEAVIEATEQITELVEKEADESEIEEAVTELKEVVEKQEEAEEALVEAVTVEESAAEVVETTSTKEEVAAEGLEKAIQVEEEASEKLEEAIVKEEKAEEEVKETIEVAKNVEAEAEKTGTEEPFSIGEMVSHGVYGDGEILDLNKAGKHWSVEVDFEEGKRRILGTFLTSKGKQNKTKEIDEESFKKPEETKKEEITAVVADTVEVDHGEYEPGTKVKHEIFGIGEVKESTPKGENYRLMIKFDDETYKTLLSTFVEIVKDDSTGENETIEVEPVEAEPVEAKPVVAEVDIVDAESMYKRPEEDKE